MDLKRCKTCKELKTETEFYGRTSECKACTIERTRRNRKERYKDHRNRLLTLAVKRSAEKGMECSIGIDDIHIPLHCKYLGVELDLVDPKSPHWPSIDRIDSSRWYVPGNVQVISIRANVLKSNATADELIAIATVLRGEEDERMESRIHASEKVAEAADSVVRPAGVQRY